MNSEWFRKLDLHGQHHHPQTDNDATPFIVTAKANQLHRGNIYGCAFNQYIPFCETQIAATCGGQYVYTYEVPLKENKLIPKLGYKFSGKEDLYTICWALDTTAKAHRVVTGGAGCAVFIIDAQTGKLMNRLESAGGHINELRTSPANSNLVACATKDKTVRLFHIRNDSCLVVIGGRDCHQDQVLSVDWSFDGKFLFSCSLDHMVMKFDLSAPHVKNHLSNACAALENGQMNSLDPNILLPQCNPVSSEVPGPSGEGSSDEHTPLAPHVPALMNKIGELGTPKGCTLPIYHPVAISSDMHEEYVDCVRSLPGSPYLVTKGCGTEKAIHVWRFGAPKGITEKKNDYFERSCTRLMTMRVPDGEIWFIRFAVDPLRRYLAVGGSKGQLHIFNLVSNLVQTPFLSRDISEKDVRCVSFSANGRMMLVVADPDVVVRLDRVPSSVHTSDLPNDPRY